MRPRCARGGGGPRPAHAGGGPGAECRRLGGSAADETAAPAPRPAQGLAARAHGGGGPVAADAAPPFRAAQARGFFAPPGFVEAGVLRLPFADGGFRGYRADKVLHELADPAAAVAEARRVLASGGRIVLCGQDWDTLVLDSDRPALTRAIVHARADTIAGPRAARQYRTLLVDAGFTEVAVEVRTVVDTDGGFRPLLDGLAAAARAAGIATDAQLDAWLSEQSARAGAGRFFLAVPIFVASATKSPQ
ncbi:methyltransferase domain-containing protein [Amycolatopsis sp. NPDC049691]|uniref:methyltransferase domain-containing protein n=1 Tax=Amycolatopsis sp. NPDC049691 TaxID=3155155 RepID=UPI00343C66DA